MTTQLAAASLIKARFAKSLQQTSIVRHDLTKTNEFVAWLKNTSRSFSEERDWFEFFESEQITRFYLDHDYSVDGPVQPEDIHDRIELCLPHVRAILRSVPLYSSLHDDELLDHFVVASRTGDGKWTKRDKNGEGKSGYKVSLRFFLDIAIVYHDIPAYLHLIGQGKSLLQPDGSPMWDTAPYSKRGSAGQKLNLITSIKTPYDKRELVPCVQDDDGDWILPAVNWTAPEKLMRYVASYAGPDFYPWMPSVAVSDEQRKVLQLPAANAKAAALSDVKEIAGRIFNPTGSRGPSPIATPENVRPETVAFWEAFVKFCPSEVGYKEWIGIACVFTSEVGAVEGRKLFHAWSKTTPRMYNKAFCDFQFDQLLQYSYPYTRPFALRVFKNKDRKLFHSFMDEFGDSIFVILKSSYNVAAWLYLQVENRLVYVPKENRWYECKQSTNLWSRIEQENLLLKPLMDKIVSLISRNLDIAQTELDDFETSGEASATTKEGLAAAKKKRDVLEKRIKWLENKAVKFGEPAAIEAVLKVMSEQLSDNDFPIKLDTNFGSLSFQDGVFNLQTGVFRFGIVPTDYLSQTLDFDFPFDHDHPVNHEVWDQQPAVIEWMNLLMKSSCQTPAWTDFLLTLLGYAFSGFAHREQLFFYFLGVGSNGKSLLVDCLTEWFKVYVGDLEPTTFEASNTKAHKHLEDVKGRRICFINEGKNVKLDDERLKRFADGESMTKEVMYGTTETLRIRSKAIFLANEEPILSNQNAILRRYVPLSWEHE
jgi:hypothetical protein